jgi:hypothetical protein
MGFMEVIAATALLEAAASRDKSCLFSGTYNVSLAPTKLRYSIPCRWCCHIKRETLDRCF